MFKNIKKYTLEILLFHILEINIMVIKFRIKQKESFIFLSYKIFKYLQQILKFFLNI